MDQQSKKEAQFLSPKSILKGRWQVIEKIGNGGFGEIYKAKDMENKKMVAVKVESCTSNKQVLKIEALILKRLQGLPHICELSGCGRTDKVNFIVMTLLGQNLSDLRKKQDKQVFSLSTVLRLGVQVVTAVQEMHNCGFLHRDIKPSNFAMGIGENSRKCFLIDFGLARQYTTPTGELKQPRPIAGFRGTVRYASVNAHLGNELGRHDDLWSVFYMLIELATGNLPWRRIREKEEAGKAKQECDHYNLIKGLPEEFKSFMSHLRELSYHDKPDYQYLITLFEAAQLRLGINNSDPYDWETEFTLPSSIASAVSGISPPIASPELHLISPDHSHSKKPVDLAAEQHSLGEKVKKICKVFQTMNSPKGKRATSATSGHHSAAIVATDRKDYDSKSNSPQISNKTKQHILKSPEESLNHINNNNNESSANSNNNMLVDNPHCLPAPLQHTTIHEEKMAENEQQLENKKVEEQQLLVADQIKEQLTNNEAAAVVVDENRDIEPEEAFVSLHSGNGTADSDSNMQNDFSSNKSATRYLIEENHVAWQANGVNEDASMSSEDDHEPRVKKFERIDSPLLQRATALLFNTTTSSTVIGQQQTNATTTTATTTTTTATVPVIVSELGPDNLSLVTCKPPMIPPRSGYFCCSARKRKFVKVSKRLSSSN